MLKTLELKFRRLDEYVQFVKMEQPHKIKRREKRKQNQEFDPSEFSTRPLIDSMNDEEKRDIARKISNVIKMYDQDPVNF